MAVGGWKGGWISGRGRLEGAVSEKMGGLM